MLAVRTEKWVVVQAQYHNLWKLQKLEIHQWTSDCKHTNDCRDRRDRRECRECRVQTRSTVVIPEYGFILLSIIV